MERWGEREGGGREGGGSNVRSIEEALPHQSGRAQSHLVVEPVSAGFKLVQLGHDITNPGSCLLAVATPRQQLEYQHPVRLHAARIPRETPDAHQWAEKQSARPNELATVFSSPRMEESVLISA